MALDRRQGDQIDKYQTRFLYDAQAEPPIIIRYHCSSDLVWLHFSCGCEAAPDCAWSSCAEYGGYAAFVELESLAKYGSLPAWRSCILPGAYSPCCFLLYRLKKNAAASRARRNAQPRPAPRPIARALLLFGATITALPEVDAGLEVDVGFELAWLFVVVDAGFVDEDAAMEDDEDVAEGADEDVAAPTCPVAAELEAAIGSVILKYSEVAITLADPTATAASYICRKNVWPLSKFCAGIPSQIKPSCVLL